MMPASSEIRGLFPFRPLQVFGLLISLCLLLPPVACAPADDDAPPPPDHVRAVVIPILLTAPIHIAQQEGYFADENLEVEFVRLTRNIEAIPALAQGQVDVGAGQLTIAVLNAIAGGARIRAVAGNGHLAADGCTFHGIIVQKDLMDAAESTGPEMFRGRRVELDIALPHAYWFDKVLQPAGLTLEDLEIVNVPTAATVDAFVTKAFDATAITEPRITQVLESGQAVLWNGTQDVVPDYQQNLVLFGPNLLDERPAVGERFIKALLRGIEQYNLGKTERNLEILEGAMRLSRDELTTMCWVSMHADGRMHPEGFAGYQEWAKQRGLVDRVLSTDELIDTRFLDGAGAGPGQQ
jgi:NitT/TauT family transport system substrate-binding protein